MKPKVLLIEDSEATCFGFVRVNRYAKMTNHRRQT